MKKFTVPVFALALVLTGAGCVNKEEPPVIEETVVEAIELSDGLFILSSSESEVTWEASKVVGVTHNGTVEVSEGSLTVEDGALTAGSVTIDMTTIVDLDQEGVMKETLEKHLKSDDFFAVETYPTATFTTTEVVPLEGIAGSNFRVDGIMTIRGIDQAISFPALIETQEMGVSFEAELELDRTLWGVNYGSGSLFDNLGDAVIRDEFIVDLELMFWAEGTDRVSEDATGEITEIIEGLEE
ncbi:YceI family protein [Candidatus Uhrbacteria bacterium CG_4_9_14_3_um_filter_50_9]|uniref:YceI family protein n=1 Tax=Candidatus Uhrbacteria bacterium CG_4_9_14_3_um_filter_50_9 TaxID=1975035 RepID=A0A2M7XAX9_9BACT|nr:MAG: YceI family protein [Candidatus Uhrbacteria bacterium CG_4_9_14_3_um_filter_50_9]